MSFTSSIKKILGLSSAPPHESGDLDDAFEAQADSESIFFLNDEENLHALSQFSGSDIARLQYVSLESLLEQNVVSKVVGGYRMPADIATQLDPESAADLGLPPWFDGEFTTENTGATASSRFSITLSATRNDRSFPIERKGPLFQIAGQQHRLTPQALEVHCAIADHDKIDRVGRPAAEIEHSNLELVTRVKSAEAQSTEGGYPTFVPNMRHLEKFRALVAQSVTVDVESQEDGSLRLSPNLGGGLNPEEVDKRWSQIPEEAEEGVLRVGNDLVAVRRKELAGARAILKRSHVPKSERAAFFAAPAEYLDSDDIDFDVSFGVRVKGIGVSAAVEFDDVTPSGIDWIQDVDALLPPEDLPTIIRTQDELDDFTESVSQAWDSERTVVPLNDALIDISDKTSTREAMEEVQKHIAPEKESGLIGSSKVHVGMIIEDAMSERSSLHAALRAPTPQELRLDNVIRSPFAHQEEGIHWLLRLIAAAESSTSKSNNVQGGILADDMGLGKTYVTLVALEQFLARAHGRGQEPGPMLAVLPLSLIENWEHEISKTFSASPFSDVVVLQSDRDLRRFRKPQSGPETSVAQDNIDADGMVDVDTLTSSLRFGAHYGENRLDKPGRLVLTTYKGLSNYQLSLSQIDWSIAVFDEAQTMKNPKTLVSRAAKGLKATFKLLATGTPVENELRDLWNLCDIAQPGLLGTWAEFRSTWISRVSGPEDASASFDGVALRAEIGEFMLRRVKEDHLKDLPTKTVHSGAVEDTETAFDPRLSVTMPEPQRLAYDAVLSRHKGQSQNGALNTLLGLRNVCLHPDLLSDKQAGQFDPHLSGRLTATLAMVKSIHEAQEKVVIFVISKSLQLRLRIWLEGKYRIAVSIVNGDTASTAQGHSASRKGLIDAFQAMPGFNVIIMSPLAAGTGLTVTEANHVIHLERHWNPAKEAQATDRVYRIGQTRPVHVYLPMTEHPDQSITSFDRNLNRLLNQKSELKDSVVIPIDAKKSMITALEL